MKKSLLALAVAALATASTVGATTVYDKDGTTLGFHGRVQSVFYSGKVSGVKDEKASINTSARFGIDLRTQLTPGIAAFAMAEWEAANGNNKPDGDDGFMNRLMWVGLDFGQYGSVKVGKFEEALKYALFATDVFDDYGCYGYSGNDDRREGVVQYQWSGYGIDALLSYAFAKDNVPVDGAYESGYYTLDDAGKINGFEYTAENMDVKYSVSAALGYTSPDILFGPITARIGFAKGDMNNPSENGVVNPGNNMINGIPYSERTEAAYGYYDSYTSYAIGVSWGKLNIGPYVGAQYSSRKLDANFDIYSLNPDTGAIGGLKEHTSGDAKVTGYEFAVGYSFANGITARTGYQTQKYENFAGEDAKSATVPVYVNWNLNSNFQVWAEARFDAGTDDATDGVGKNFADHTNGVYGNLGENVYSMGMRYNF